ncbi:phosphodiester glycosidase family protein [Hymenobacter yonginensis]|uniref:Phosphodiester glycosidase family protein n=1 Tax=Hymenobacter yonginensis TaxID=748197 RepID=A0ABY7PTA7_9BACT|nr:phosphodiester glycosidase family protein [Hymenobacter yonginensis]WBO86139.1 phosphodiester glycosidase family protein [Hymenobacter yonginensis]
MNVRILRLLLAGLLLGIAGGAFFMARPQPRDPVGRFLSYRVDLSRQHLRLFWLDEQRRPLRSLGRLRRWLADRGDTLEFAMNGGMFRPGNAPLGLYIENGRLITPLDTGAGAGNFYLKPNGVFYLTPDNQAGVCRTADFARLLRQRSVRYATQSGPMLVLDGQLHPAFRAGSANRQIRNGVGVLPDGRVLCVLSREPVNFYDFARYFQQQGCRNALYLDGFVSRAYLPAQGWTQTDGDLGVLVGVTSR